MEKYNHKSIEKKWKKYWEENKVFEAKEDKKKKKFYGLIEFPYPSGDGLHAGHLRSNTAMDIICRKRRMQGYNVLYPIGFDSFGLPAENYAVKKGIKPQVSIAKNIKTFTKQLKEGGFSFDWSRAFSTTDKDYYKWTQWIFVQMFKKGLAYKAKENINWCTSCKIGLANEEVVNGACERCGGEVVKKDKEQWMLKITEYADRLIKDLEKVNYLERIKTQQINWIGKSNGAEVKFKIQNSKYKINPKSKIQNTKCDKILLATNNLSKKKRIEKLLKNVGLNIEILLPKDLNTDIVENATQGGLFEQAKAKALAYRNKTDLPILGIDSGFFIKGEQINPVKVKRNALEGKDEKELNQKEIAKLLVAYYKKIADKNNGKIEACWKDVFVLSLADGSIEEAESIREVILTNKIKGEIDIYFPIRSLYKVKATGKYISEQSKEEELKELQPITNVLIQLLAHSADDELEVFTTRPDTLFGATFMVVAPEHPLIEDLRLQIVDFNKVKEYIKKAKKKSDLERADMAKEKTGVELKGLKAINPVNNQEIPIWVADYVMMGYGTGAIMAVPGHDSRDYMFARKYNLPVIEVVKPSSQQELRIKNYELGECFEGEGVAVNSGKFDGLTTQEFKKKIIAWLEEKGLGKEAVNYKLHDWIFSRQRYWGEPIPMINCEKCGWISVLEKDLPVILPDIDDFMPTDDGESPLAKLDNWIKVKCPKCGGPAKRETDVMPNWAGSNWYFLRYTDPKNSKALADKDKLKYWTPVDWYNGGMEHTTLHLLYSRFVYKFLYDIGAVPKECGNEPYKKRTAHGMILGKGGIKMSKSKGNVINPDKYIEKYGADTVRLYEMFMGPFDQAIAWDDKGVVGAYRFLNKVWEMQSKVKKECVNHKDLERLLHQTIKKVGEDIEKMRFNTAVSQLMILVNEMERSGQLSAISYQLLLLLLYPFAPHLAEELWSKLGYNKSIIYEKWPEYDKNLIQENEIQLVVQVNGKVRDKIKASADISEDDANKLAMKSEKVQKWLKGKQPKKVIFIKGKLVNIVV